MSSPVLSLLFLSHRRGPSSTSRAVDCHARVGRPQGERKCPWNNVGCTVRVKFSLCVAVKRYWYIYTCHCMSTECSGTCVFPSASSLAGSGWNRRPCTQGHTVSPFLFLLPASKGQRANHGRGIGYSLVNHCILTNGVLDPTT